MEAENKHRLVIGGHSTKDIGSSQDRLVCVAFAVAMVVKVANQFARDNKLDIRILVVPGQLAVISFVSNSVIAACWDW